MFSIVRLIPWGMATRATPSAVNFDLLQWRNRKFRLVAIYCPGQIHWPNCVTDTKMKNKKLQHQKRHALVRIKRPTQWRIGNIDCLSGFSKHMYSVYVVSKHNGILGYATETVAWHGSELVYLLTCMHEPWTLKAVNNAVTAHYAFRLLTFSRH